MTAIKMNKIADYGNWVPMAMMKMMWGTSIGLCAVTIALFALLKAKIPGVIALLITLASLAMTIYMTRCRQLFSFNGGGVMGNIHQFLVNHFPFMEAVGAGGAGTILDIGCGAGALTNRIAITYPKAVLTGIDFWGAEWSYAKEQCERNAQLEGVANRVTFRKGDAAKLDFADGTFDGAVSNFVFHEVRSAKDKRDVVREGLRVVRDGGAFAFQDLFSQTELYGDMQAFAPWMIKGAGLIYGIK